MSLNRHQEESAREITAPKGNGKWGLIAVGVLTLFGQGVWRAQTAGYNTTKLRVQIGSAIAQNGGRGEREALNTMNMCRQEGIASVEQADTHIEYFFPYEEDIMARTVENWCLRKELDRIQKETQIQVKNVQTK